MNKLNIYDTFNYVYGKKKITGISGGYFYEEGNIKQYIFGKTYDISSQNINVQFFDNLAVDNDPDGIKVYFGRTGEDESWIRTTENTIIHIFENNVELDYSYFIGLTAFDTLRDLEVWDKKSYSFIFPFVTAGNTYTFIFNPSGNKEYKRTITADKTCSVKVNKTKMASNFNKANITYTDTATSKNLKINSVLKDIFDGNYKDIINYESFSIQIMGKNLDASTNEETETWCGSFGQYTKEFSALTSYDGFDFMNPNSFDEKNWIKEYIAGWLADKDKVYFEIAYNFACEADPIGYFSPFFETDEYKLN